MNKTEAKNILTDIFNLKSYIEEEIAKLPTRFNIVDSIVGAHKETSNTKLLGSFLDCIFEKDYKFINSLLEYIKNNCNIDSFKEIDFYNEYITINIEKEVVINKEEKGKIDILLTSDNYNIIIENKINTRDSENQLQKYYNVIPNRTNTYLIYLTRNGDEPKNNFYNKEKLILLSHKTIIDWLESIKEKEEVKNNDSLYSAIIQIIETEQIITNSLEGDIMKEEIKKYFNNKYPNKFKEYPEVINYTKLLKSAIEAVADIFYNYFENNIEYYILKLINDSEIKKIIK
ncbi:PD-(D/E)XK nuclease family protein [Brachyspira hyodysenteriae]|uniref:PD-(D/E)XK nuclease family protein n=1 Tax=Brachyspira hyodysenteriae TaxID=159 RepID=UPI0022CD2265|nr:PD-(D/E)XK nuclease family protein [Brachyspira hyodysenteriae]MCZ9886223.1 PD-(D/E)XK nuclease family protein [Brachyspira hyodysenteriae]MCZ9980932.1 PD-(D/E)XK nuclease family protein [Brachyspira hyodysenteriae]